MMLGFLSSNRTEGISISSTFKSIHGRRVQRDREHFKNNRQGTPDDVPSDKKQCRYRLGEAQRVPGS